MDPSCNLGTALEGKRNLNCLGLRAYPLEELKEKINVVLNYRKIKLYLMAKKSEVFKISTFIVLLYTFSWDNICVIQCWVIIYLYSLYLFD